MKSSTKSSFLTHLTKLALSDQLVSVNRYKHATIRTMFGQNSSKSSQIETFISTNRAALYKAIMKMDTKSSAYLLQPTSEWNNTPSTINEVRQKEGNIEEQKAILTSPPAAAMSRQDMIMDPQQPVEVPPQTQEANNESTNASDSDLVGIRNLEKSSNIIENIMNNGEATMEVGHKVINDLHLIIDTIDKPTSQHESLVNSVVSTGHGNESEIMEGRNIDTISNNNDACNVKANDIDIQSRASTTSLLCSCGRTFSKESDLTRHTAFAARKEYKNKEHSKALDHLELILRHRFSTKHIKNTISELKDKVLESMEMTKRKEGTNSQIKG